VKGGVVDALTRFRVLERFDFCTLVEAEIEAGKHHQIRRHFAMINHPLVLDSVYGDKKFNGPFSQKFHYHRFFLHASGVRFPHPVTGEMVKIEDPDSIALRKIVKRLREGK
jgi:23S rRNA pseudouridine955/2504/2580 synthase